MSEYEKNIAYRESSQIVSTDEYFKARPQIDNHDRRKVFESGFERGWEASKKHYEATPSAESITIPIAEYEAMKKDADRLKFLIDNDLWFTPLEEQKRGYRSTMPDAKPEIWFQRIGWMVSNQNQEYKTVIEAIDKAMEI